MPPRQPIIPPYDHAAPGARVTDRQGVRYSVTGRELVPVSALPGAHMQTLLRVRRDSDGEERTISRTAYSSAVVTYNPPPRIRKRIDKRRRPR